MTSTPPRGQGWAAIRSRIVSTPAIGTTSARKGWSPGLTTQAEACAMPTNVPAVLAAWMQPFAAAFTPRSLAPRSEALGAGLEVAVTAGQVVASITFGCVGDLWADMGIGGGDQFTSPSDQPGIGIVRESPDLGNAPDRADRHSEVFCRNQVG